MPNNNEAVVFYCPSCGASVAMHGDQGTCAFCGTTIERPKDAQAQPPRQPPAWSPRPVTVMSTTLAGPRRGGSCLGTLVSVIIVAAVLFGAGAAITGGRLIAGIMGLLSGSSSLPGVASALPPMLPQLKLDSIRKIAAVLPRDGKGGDLIVYVYGITNSRYSIALLDGGTQAARWQSQPLSKNAYQGLLAAGHDMVYLTDKDQLLALRLTDGTLAWQTPLEVEPASSCEECLRLAGEHVVVLEKSGGLQAFDAQTGKLAWSVRLPNTPRHLPLVGGRLATIQPSEDKQGQIISFLDPATGKAALKLDPHCPKPNEFSKRERPQSDTPLLFSADGSTMYAIYGFFSKCAQAFDLTSGKPRWEEMLDEKLVSASWSAEGALVTEKEIFAVKDKTLWTLDTTNGKTRTLVEDKEYDLRPLALRDDTLIVLARPTWDPQRQALWGLDVATGERRWQEPLQAHELREGSSSGDWDWQLTPKGLVVVQVLRDEAHLIVETLNPRTGVSGARQDTALTGLHSPSLSDARWTDDTGWLTLDYSHIYAIDLVTGKTAYQL